MAVVFLTRLPLPIRTTVSAQDVGRSSAWFPLVGALLGSGYAAAAWALWPALPGSVVAAVIIIIEALATGALHFDGLADAADGLGGGRDRAGALRIMRDHAIGAYGAVALIALILLKAAAIAALCDRHRAVEYLIVAPALGRWTTVLLGWWLPDARSRENSAGDFIGVRELVFATLIAGVLAGAVLRWRGLVCWAAVILAAGLLGRWFKARIGGVTGDTLGASAAVCEAVVLVTGLALSPL